MTPQPPAGVRERRIPMRCNVCGNVAMTPRSEDEERAVSLLTSCCPRCDDSTDDCETFYEAPTGEFMDYGSWMDWLEATGSRA